MVVLNVHLFSSIIKTFMVLPLRIELRIHDYKSRVIPFNYRSTELLIMTYIVKIILVVMAGLEPATDTL